jgi:hypothetical protein
LRCETDDRFSRGTRFKMHTRRWRETRIAERYVTASTSLNDFS